MPYNCDLGSGGLQHMNRTLFAGFVAGFIGGVLGAYVVIHAERGGVQQVREWYRYYQQQYDFGPE